MTIQNGNKPPLTKAAQIAARMALAANPKATGNHSNPGPDCPACQGRGHVPHVEFGGVPCGSCKGTGKAGV